MSLIPLKPVLDYAKKNKFAHGAFNVNMVCQAEAIIDIHDTFRSAAIIQGAELANAFMGGRADFQNGSLEDKRIGAKRIADAVKELSAAANIPVVLHLDHGRSLEAVMVAIEAGYTSVMIDGSSLPYDENVELTREVVKYAHPRGVTVEGELGVLSGVEDFEYIETSSYTNPLLVCDFFQKTGCDCLALSYGTMHGVTKGKNVQLRKEIVIAALENMRHEKVEGTLVSHGSSTVPSFIVNEINQLGGKIENAAGIPMPELLDAISCGISKVNIDTDIRLAVTRNVREMFVKDVDMQKAFPEIWNFIKKNPAEFDPRIYFVPIMEPLITGTFGRNAEENRLKHYIQKGVKEAVGSLIVQFGSYGDAPHFESESVEKMAEYYQKAEK